MSVDLHISAKVSNLSLRGGVGFVTLVVTPTYTTENFGEYKQKIRDEFNAEFSTTPITMEDITLIALKVVREI